MGKVRKCKDCGVTLDEENQYRAGLLCSEDGKRRERERSRDRQLNNRKFYMQKKYIGMQRRTDGRDTQAEYRSRGKPILSWEEFWEWYLNTEQIFEKMFKEYLDSGENPCLAPSVDRVDESRGYEKGNLQWLTVGDNSSKRERFDDEQASDI